MVFKNFRLIGDIKTLTWTFSILQLFIVLNNDPIIHECVIICLAMVRMKKFGKFLSNLNFY